MPKAIEMSLVIKKETIYGKIRKSLLGFFFQKDAQMIQRLDQFMAIKRPDFNRKIIIPKEIGT